MRKACIPLLLLLCALTSLYAQTPPNVSPTIPFDTDLSDPVVSGGFNSVADIQAGFNNAKRVEEGQFCLSQNSIADITMPSQAVWDNLPSDEKFLFLINAEREARAGLDYCQGEGPVMGLPFTGVELNIDYVAQNHVDFLIASQSTSVMSQEPIIDQNVVIGGSGCAGPGLGTKPNCCHQSINGGIVSYRLRSFANPPDPSTIVTEEIEAKAVYSWIYGFSFETESLSRRVVLLQNLEQGGDPASPRGFTNDYGAVSDEGFIGIGLKGGVPAPNSNGFTHIDFVILTYFDPVPQSVGCQYDCTTCDPCPIDLVENAVPINPDYYVASNSIHSAGVVQTGSVDMVAGNFIQLNSNFEVILGAVYHAQIDDCFFTLD